MTFKPGLPHFFQLTPMTWRETVWSRQRCVFCPELLAEGDVTACAEHRAQLDATLTPWEGEEAMTNDPVPLPPHDEDAGRQWELDHPDGVISDEEQEAMDRYAYESCREEGHS